LGGQRRNCDQPRERGKEQARYHFHLSDRGEASLAVAIV
jgi:hypothetical protein